MKFKWLIIITVILCTLYRIKGIFVFNTTIKFLFNYVIYSLQL